MTKKSSKAKRPVNEQALACAAAAEAGGNYRKALRILLPLAETGNTEAQYRVSMLYFDEIEDENGAFDADTASRWAAKAARSGHPGAQSRLAEYFFSNSQYADALCWYRKAAEQGNSDGEKGLGDLYFHGRGVERDYRLAIEHYRRAADRGNQYAQREIAWMYEKGLGVAQSYEKAVHYYRLAAEQDNASAQWKLGELSYRGLGTVRDDVEAYAWLLLALLGGLHKLGSRTLSKLESSLTARQTDQARRLAFQRHYNRLVSTQNMPESDNAPIVDVVIREHASGPERSNHEQEVGQAVTVEDDNDSLATRLVGGTWVFLILLSFVLITLLRLPFWLVRDQYERLQGKPDGLYFPGAWALIKERSEDEYYQGILGNYEAILPEIAEIIGAEYEPGAFQAVEAHSIGSSDGHRLWFLEGQYGRLVVDVENGGYSACLLQATGDILATAANVIRDQALHEGAAPHALDPIARSNTGAELSNRMAATRRPK